MFCIQEMLSNAFSCHHSRSLRRWLARRRLQSLLSSTANRLAEKESRWHSNGKVCAPLLTELERTTLRVRLQERRKERRAGAARRSSVVFFGDGQFGHCRGHAAIPKKSLVHELAVRVPTILIDEYLTSRRCFCGRELATSNTATRVRIHQDGGDECAAFRCGIRDELATMNIALASLRCLRKQSWPTHRCRKPPG